MILFQQVRHVLIARVFAVGALLSCLSTTTQAQQLPDLTKPIDELKAALQAPIVEGSGGSGPAIKASMTKLAAFIVKHEYTTWTLETIHRDVEFVSGKGLDIGKGTFAASISEAGNPRRYGLLIITVDFKGHKANHELIIFSSSKKIVGTRTAGFPVAQVAAGEEGRTPFAARNGKKPPLVFNLSPISGPLDGGTTIRIDGPVSYYLTGYVQIIVGDLPTTDLVVNLQENYITCNTVAALKPGPVYVWIKDAQDSILTATTQQFTYLPKGGGATVAFTGDTFLCKGKKWKYDSTNAKIVVTPFDAVFNDPKENVHGVKVRIEDKVTSWDLYFTAAKGKPIVKGVYKNATRHPFNKAGKPGVSLSGDARAYDDLNGSFEIVSYELNKDKSVKVLRATFKFRGQGQNKDDFGSISYDFDPGK